MALDKDILGNAIADALLLYSGHTDKITPAENSKVHEVWKIISDEIIKHFETNAEILPGSFLDGDSNPITGVGEIT